MSAPPCPGTRQPVEAWFKAGTKSLGTFTRRYGRGHCRACGKVVTCHKDRTAVAHTANERR